MRHHLACALLCAGLTIGAASRAADTTCSLKQLVSLSTTTNPSGSILLPSRLDGRPAQLALDTGAVWSAVKASVGAGYSHHTASRGVVGAGGVVTDDYVTIPALELGTLRFRNVDFYIEPEQFSPDPAVAGNLAANALSIADLEIDPAAGKMALFSQQHCAGQVLYWPHSDRIAVPFPKMDGAQIRIPVALDGHQMTALVDTGAAISILYADAAERIFGLTPDGPGMETAGAAATLDGKRLPLSRHQFGTLAIGDVTFNHPWITIAPKNRGSGWSATAPPDLILGMHQLRELHLYIAYGERVLYATTVAGDAKAAGGQPVNTQPSTDARQGDWLDYSNAKPAIDSATAHLRRGETDEAIADLTRAIATAPRLAMLYVDRGNAYLGRHDYPHALADFDNALTLQPNDPAILEGRGFARLGGDQREAALADFNAALAHEPHRAGALYGRSIARGRGGDTTDAATDLAAAKSIDPLVERHYPLL